MCVFEDHRGNFCRSLIRKSQWLAAGTQPLLKLATPRSRQQRTSKYRGAGGNLQEDHRWLVAVTRLLDVDWELGASGWTAGNGCNIFVGLPDIF
jgi:hypothetical protein